MNVIRDRDGNIIQRSKNLAGIRRYVAGKHGLGPQIKVLSIDHLLRGHVTGKLCILFKNGASYETNFASYGVLKSWVRNWRAAYGAPLLVNGEKQGKVSGDNPALVNKPDDA
jgi:hypothetical protein